MATRTIEGTLDTLSIDAGSEITYLGATSSGNPGEAIRAFRVNPGGTGNIIVKLDRTHFFHKNLFYFVYKPCKAVEPLMIPSVDRTFINSFPAEPVK